MEEINRLKLVILIFMMVTFGGLIYNNAKLINLKGQFNKDGIYDYCVEWDGWVHRENLFFNCMNIENGSITILCWWDITDNILTIYLQDNTTKTYTCSKYLKSMEV